MPYECRLQRGYNARQDNPQHRHYHAQGAQERHCNETDRGQGAGRSTRYQSAGIRHQQA